MNEQTTMEMTPHIDDKNKAKSKRIAENTLILFVRMFLIMIVNLYALRVVIHALGEVNYGIFNAIAGFVLMSSCISMTLALAVQRFYSYAIGKGESERLPEIFSASINIVFVISFFLIVLLETLGWHFVSSSLMEPSGHIPLERLAATKWIFHCSIFSFIFTFLQMPFISAIIAHEDMGLFASVSFLECLGRLGVAMIVSHLMVDRLVFYGIGLLIVSTLVFSMYCLICRWRYIYYHYVYVRSRTIYRDLLSFAGWTMYGTVANVAMIQGNTILFMKFFGPLSNVAYGIATQVYNAANSLCSSIIVTFRPAMIKSYAENDYSFLDKTFMVSNKFLSYFLLSIALPLLFEMRTILTWWLGDSATESSILFSRLFIIYWLCTSLHHPITIIIQATGKVKDYFLWVESVSLFCLPLTYFLFRMGVPAFGTFVSMISLCLIAHLVRLICLKRVYSNFNISSYLQSLILPLVLISIISTFVSNYLHAQIHTPLLRFLTVGLLSPLTVLVLALSVGISKNERRMIIGFLHSFIKRHS